MAGESIGPWSIVNSYSKTVITIAAGFLAFTGTFYTNILGHQPSSLTFWSLVICWIFLMGACGAALFAAGRLTGFLDGKRNSKNQVLLSANVSYFFLAGAVLAFFIALMEPSSGSSIPPEKAVAISSDLLTTVDTTSEGTIAPLSAAWTEATDSWHIELLSGSSDTFQVTVDGHSGKVKSFRFR